MLENNPMGSIKDIPNEQANITIKPFTNAITFNDKGEVYLTPLQQEIIGKMKFKDGHIFLNGKADELTDIEVQNLSTKEYINELDMTLLRMFYTIVLNEFEKNDFNQINSNIVIYVPDLLRALDIKGNQSKEQIGAFINGINKFKNLIGVIKTQNARRKRTYTSYYALLNFNYYDDTKNTFSFNAPFLEYVVRSVYMQSIKKDAKGLPILDKNGKPKRNPCHSYLIKSEIAKERNYAAVENVNIIVTTIEQAGGTGAHLSAATIVERNAQLLKQLEDNDPKNRQRVLDRTFKKTWELLHTMTLLEEKYIDLKLPDPKDKNNYPKLKNLKSYVFNFTHKGKRKKQ